MKKLSIFAVIATLIFCGMTKAMAQESNMATKTLSSRQTMKVRQNTSMAKSATRNLLKANTVGSTDPYWATAMSFYNPKYGYFSYTDLSETDYSIEVTIDGDKVTFYNIVDNSNYASSGWQGCNPVTGTYDAEKRTITIETQPINEQNTREDYTVLGDLYSGSEAVYAVLVAGDFSTVPDDKGDYQLYQEKKLVFDVSEDGTELIPRTGFGSYALFAEDNSHAGFLNFYKSAIITKMTNEPQLEVSPETLDLSEKNLFTGIPYTQEIKLKNKGLSNTKYTISTSTDELSVEGREEVPGGNISLLPITLTAKNSGPFSGTVTFTDENGKSTTLTVKANTNEVCDYSSVIKNGDIKIYPYEESTSSMIVTSDITGFPVLASTNVGDDSQSGVNISITVPEGNVATFSWKGMATGLYPNQAMIYLNGDPVNKSLDGSEKSNEHDLSDKIILKSGTYDMTFIYSIILDWYTMGVAETKLQAYFYDFDLTLYPVQENGTDVSTHEVNFAKSYFDNIEKTDTAEIKLYNLGSKNLEINSVTGDGCFSYVGDVKTIEPYQYGIVKLTFTRKDIGEHSGDVVLHTSAGDVTIHCNATTEKIIYDYSPIVEKGDFSFDTSIEHPWTLDGSKACSSTSGLTSDSTIDSWLEVSFIVPEGKTGTLTWSGRNSSTPFGAFLDEILFSDGTVIYSDGTEITKFAGTSSAGSDELEAPMTFSAGLHRVCFLYTKSSREPEGEDRYVLYNLALDLSDASDISTMTGTKMITNREYYSVTGEKLSAPAKGINIIKNTYDDGTTSTSKIIIK